MQNSYLLKNAGKKWNKKEFKIKLDEG